MTTSVPYSKNPTEQGNVIKVMTTSVPYSKNPTEQGNVIKGMTTSVPYSKNPTEQGNVIKGMTTSVPYSKNPTEQGNVIKRMTTSVPYSKNPTEQGNVIKGMTTSVPYSKNPTKEGNGKKGMTTSVPYSQNPTLQRNIRNGRMASILNSENPTKQGNTTKEITTSVRSSRSPTKQGNVMKGMTTSVRNSRNPTKQGNVMKGMTTSVRNSRSPTKQGNITKGITTSLNTSGKEAKQCTPLTAIKPLITMPTISKPHKIKSQQKIAKPPGASEQQGEEKEATSSAKSNKLNSNTISRIKTNVKAESHQTNKTERKRIDILELITNNTVALLNILLAMWADISRLLAYSKETWQSFYVVKNAISSAAASQTRLSLAYGWNSLISKYFLRRSQDNHCYTEKPSKLSIEQLERETKSVIRQAGIVLSLNQAEDTNRFFENEVKLKTLEKNQVWKSCRRLQESLVSALNSGTSWSWDCLNSGSSYDGTKVKRPDEVDCMFYPKDVNNRWLRTEFDGAPPGYCFLKLQKLPFQMDRYLELRNLTNADKTTDDLFVSSEKFRQKTFHLMKMELQHHRRARVNAKQKAGSPSLAVEYDAIPDANGQGLRTIDMDLVPAIHLDYWLDDFNHNLRYVPDDIAERIKKAGFDVIPKEITAAGFDKEKHLLWRLSFSRAEKPLTQYADRKGPSENSDGRIEPTCRKWVLRMLKRTLELMKETDSSTVRRGCGPLKQLISAVQVLKNYQGRNITIEKFSTFQIRTLLWTEFYITYPGVHLWQKQSRRNRFLHTVKNVQKMLSGKMRVRHFFIPDLDIMAEVPTEEREFLYIMFGVAYELF